MLTAPRREELQRGRKDENQDIGPHGDQPTVSSLVLSGVRTGSFWIRSVRMTPGCVFSSNSSHSSQRGLDLEALRVRGKSGSKEKVRFKPHFSVCVVYKAAGHRTPGPSGPRDAVQPLTLLWKKLPPRDPVISPKPLSMAQQIQDQSQVF